MNKIRMNEYLKSAIIIVIGFLMAFFGDLVSLLFYIGGGAVILGSLIMMILGIYNHKAALEVPKAIIGAIIGVGIVITPRLLLEGIPFIVGIVMLFGGIKGVVISFKLGKVENKLWIATAIISVALIAAGIYFVFNPDHVSRIMIIIVGFLMIFSGLLNIFKELFRKKDKDSDDSSTSGVIDLKSYKVRDEE